VVNVSDGGTPYIVLSAGITADYVYPIVSASNPIPNPEKEAILFINDAGYQRIYDAFRNNPSESYIVGEFINGANGEAIIDEINE